MEHRINGSQAVRPLIFMVIICPSVIKFDLGQLNTIPTLVSI